jgi:hypothetical protein
MALAPQIPLPIPSKSARFLSILKKMAVSGLIIARLSFDGKIPVDLHICNHLK